MTDTSYILQIDVGKDRYEFLNDLFGVNCDINDLYWQLEVREGTALFPEGVGFLISALKKNLPVLKKENIDVADISIWYLYEYEQQCNIEFNPRQLKAIGELGIVLCISCWQKGSVIVFPS